MASTLNQNSASITPRRLLISGIGFKVKALNHYEPLRTDLVYARLVKPRFRWSVPSVYKTSVQSNLANGGIATTYTSLYILYTFQLASMSPLKCPFPSREMPHLMQDSLGSLSVNNTSIGSCVLQTWVSLIYSTETTTVLHFSCCFRAVD